MFFPKGTWILEICWLQTCDIYDFWHRIGDASFKRPRNYPSQLTSAPLLHKVWAVPANICLWVPFFVLLPCWVNPLLSDQSIISLDLLIKLLKQVAIEGVGLENFQLLRMTSSTCTVIHFVLNLRETAPLYRVLRDTFWSPQVLTTTMITHLFQFSPHMRN